MPEPWAVCSGVGRDVREPLRILAVLNGTAPASSKLLWLLARSQLVRGGHGAGARLSALALCPHPCQPQEPR